MIEILRKTISIKDLLLIWYLIYSVAVIFCKPVRQALIKWLQSLNKDKEYDKMIQRLKRRK